MTEFSLTDLLVNAWHSQSREMKPRDVIWASEIGKDPFDRYWKMKGVQPSNEPSSRTHFKFFIGDAIEGAILTVLERAGFTVELQKDREKCRVSIPGMMTVEGKFDAIISSNGDWDGALRKMLEEPLSLQMAYVDKYANNIAGYCRQKYPNGFPRQVIEIKTINSMILKSKLTKGTLARDYFYYHLQLYTYLKSLGMDKGSIFYISKDDGIFHIEEVQKTQELEDAWMQDVKNITDMVRNDIEPDFPPFYTLVDGKYKVNWSAIGSSYLTKFTGKELEDIKFEVESQVRRLNYQITKENKKKEKNDV